MAAWQIGKLCAFDWLWSAWVCLGLLFASLCAHAFLAVILGEIGEGKTCTESNPSRVFQHVQSFLKERCKPGSSLVVSVSGGVDSMGLSHCLISLRRRWHLNSIDYNIRASSEVEASFVETWARKVALPLKLVRLNKTEAQAQRDLSRAAFEDFSRRARYEAYYKLMEDDRAVAVLTGHHQDDAAENVLWNLFMGRSLFHIPVMGPEAFIEHAFRDASQASAGEWHSLFLRNDSVVFACGRNDFGQLGDATRVTRIYPVQIAKPMMAVSGDAERFCDRCWRHLAKYAHGHR
eukprot:Skav228022  [mRNA]  locus=scaffold1073:157490:164431:+ [translate_table: standard]